MKRVLITGAHVGIGPETARLLAARNYQVTLVAPIEQQLVAAIKELPGQGHKYIVADLTTEEDLATVTADLRVQKYDVLINNTTTGPHGNFTNIPLDQHLGLMCLNMDVLVMLSHSFLRGATAGDSLVNIGSILAHASFPGGAVYAGARSFVVTFSESLSYEFKDKGVFVLGFNPRSTRPGTPAAGGHSDSPAPAGGSVDMFPDLVLSRAGQVAKQLVDALEKRVRPHVVHGWKNRLMLFGFRFLSRKLAVNL
ncbi:MAG TPA: SDR family NAD(P)-dependent oxidoreductase [Puia sp.]|nr:SDR family NAD(P)-dependent oxidoreductase [Puia sp.]